MPRPILGSQAPVSAVPSAYSKVAKFIFFAAPSFYEQARRLSGGEVEEVWYRVLDQAKETGGKVKDEVEEAVHEAATE